MGTQTRTEPGTRDACRLMCFSGGCETCWTSGCTHHGPVPGLLDDIAFLVDADTPGPQARLGLIRERLGMR